MAKHIYRIGDVAILRDGFTKTAEQGRTCRIVGLLPPSEQGDAQYRVRFVTENCERRIMQSDIERTDDGTGDVTRMAEGRAANSPWLVPLATRRAR